MVGTGALDQVVRLAASQRWRLVLVGDPRQLQAVGRGGMFDELCRVGRPHELATIHRFRHPWEQAASLQLRSGNPEALDAYIDRGRVSQGTFADLAAAAARQWIEHAAAGRTVAVVAETNEHVDALNRAIQGNAERSATSASALPVSQEARPRPSAKSSSPGVTTGRCAPTGTNRSATATAGPSSASGGRGA
jgi:ATP-dependent exoDNAse (exonuclease V) alpha subunit